MLPQFSVRNALHCHDVEATCLALNPQLRCTPKSNWL